MRNDALERLLGRSNEESVSMEKPKNRPPTTPDYDEEVLHTMFTLSKWSGLDNYVCRCGAGFLDPKTAVDHWLSQHSGWTPPPATDIVDTGLVAPSGNPIYKEVETEPNDDKEDDE